MIQWVKLIPKEKFIEYYNQVLINLQNTDDFVLIYEHCSCIHEMLKEIDYWLKMSSNGNSRSKHSVDLIDFGENKNDSSDNQILMSA